MCVCGAAGPPVAPSQQQRGPRHRHPGQPAESCCTGGAGKTQLNFFNLNAFSNISTDTYVITINLSAS